MAWFSSPTLIDDEPQPSVEVLRKRRDLKLAMAGLPELCGGKGGKPGPCPGGKKDAAKKEPKKVKPKAKAKAKPKPKAKAKPKEKPKPDKKPDKKEEPKQPDGKKDEKPSAEEMSKKFADKAKVVEKYHQAQKEFSDYAKSSGRTMAKMKTLSDKVRSSSQAAGKATEAARQQILDKFGVKDPIRVNQKDSSELVGKLEEYEKYEPKTAAEKRALNDGMNFISKLTSGDKGSVDVTLTQMKYTPEPRAGYDPADKVINVGDATERPSVIAHEIAHAIEQQKEGALDQVKEFLNKRVGNETPTDMEKFGMPGEMGRKDDFAKLFGERSAYYVGKSYASGATEVLSMGVQKMYEDPISFFTKDPEYAQLVLDVLGGRRAGKN